MIDWILHRLLDDASREVVIGDLHEGYMHVRRHGGPVAARLWYVAHALRSIVTVRVTGQRTIAQTRMDDDKGARPTLRDLLRPALRQFRDQPLYATAVAGTLALAIGAACVSVAVAKRALFDPLPYRGGDEIVSVLTVVDGLVSAVSPHVLQDLRASQSPLVELAPIRPTAAAFATADATETITINFVEADYFGFLGVTPALGRVWTADEPDAVVISAAFWRDRLGRRADVVGESITLDGRTRRIVGVLPADFTTPYFVTTHAWAPLEMAPLLAGLRAQRSLTVLARRARDTSPKDLDAYMAVFSRQLQERFPEVHANQTWTARPLRDELVGASGPALLGVAGAAILLLLIVTANIAGLATAHTVATRHQIAIRAALGATPRRLFVDHLVNSTLLSLVGAVTGVWIGFALVRVVARYQQAFLARLAPIVLDLDVAALALCVGLVVGIGASLLPRRLLGAVSHDALRTARGSSGDVRASFTRASLVVAQVAIALVLLVGAGLLVRTVQHLTQRDLGFAQEGLAWIQVNLPGRKYQTPEAQIQFERDVIERVALVPGVRSVTASVGYPLWGGSMAGMMMKADPPGTPRREVAYLSLSPNFTRDVGARIVTGRDLLPTDTLNTTRVVVINETMARMFWPDGDAIGSEVHIGGGGRPDQWITIVGVMADMRAHGLTAPIRPTAFGSTLQYSWPRRHIGVRVAGTPPTLAADLKNAIHAVDPAVSVGTLTLAEQNLSNAMAQHRLAMLALTIFGGIALVLCISGLYAVIVLNSQQRRREYAIRVALGARAGSVRWMVLWHALQLAGIGVVTGLAAATLGSRTLQGLLHGVQPLDAPTFAVSVLVILALATFAAWPPARRAEHVDPGETLRSE